MNMYIYHLSGRRTKMTKDDHAAHGSDDWFEQITTVDKTLLLEVANAFHYLRGYAEATHLHWQRDADMKVGKRLKALSGDLTGYNEDIDRIHSLVERVQAKCNVIMNGGVDPDPREDTPINQPIE